MAITLMPFGPYGNLENVSFSRSYGTFELWHGDERYEYFLETEIGISVENSLCGSSGIAVNQTIGSGGSGNLTSVALTEEEVVSGPKKVARNPGVSLELQSGRLLKALEDCFLILGYNHTVALAGRGIPVWDGDDQGTTPGSKTFNAARGSLSIVSHADAKIRALGETQPLRDAPHSWTGELSCFVANGTPTSHILSLSADVLALIPSNTVYVISHGITMNGDMTAMPSETYNVTCHPTT